MVGHFVCENKWLQLPGLYLGTWVVPYRGAFDEYIVIRICFVELQLQPLAALAVGGGVCVCGVGGGGQGVRVYGVGCRGTGGCQGVG